MSKFRKPIVLSGKRYSTITKVQEEAQRIKKTATLNEPLVNTDNDFMRSLIKFHPDYETKKGPGIAAIQVRHHPMHFQQREFCIIQSNGNKVHFSNKKIFSMPSKKKKFEKASRFAIYDQIRQFKTAAFRYHSTLLCPLTNEIINERNCHVDHVAPLFKQLKQEFIEHNNIDVNTVEFRSDINGNVHFEDDEIRAAFETFHRERATLRVTSVNGNSNREKIEKKRVECKNHPVTILEDKNNSLLEAFGYTSKLSTRPVSELFLKK